MGINDNCNLTLLCSEFFVIHALQGVTLEGAEQDIACKIQQGIHKGATEDAIAQAITCLVSHIVNRFMLMSGGRWMASGISVTRSTS